MHSTIPVISAQSVSQGGVKVLSNYVPSIWDQLYRHMQWLSAWCLPRLSCPSWRPPCPHPRLWWGPPWSRPSSSPSPTSSSALRSATSEDPEPQYWRPEQAQFNPLMTFIDFMFELNVRSLCFIWQISIFSIFVILIIPTQHFIQKNIYHTIFFRLHHVSAYSEKISFSLEKFRIPPKIWKVRTWFSWV